MFCKLEEDSSDSLHATIPEFMSSYGENEPSLKPYMSPINYPNLKGTDQTKFSNAPLDTFPANISPEVFPASLDLRPQLGDQTASFVAPDQGYSQVTKVDVQDMALLDAKKLVADNEGLSRSKALDEAINKLTEHCRERMEYVYAASDRLQAITGMRNDWTIDLPGVDASVFPRTLGTPNTAPRLASAYENAGIFPHGQSAAAEFSNLGYDNHCSNPSNTQHDGDIGDDSLCQESADIPPIATQVDPVTGKGLMDWLLMMGEKYGMRKRQCTSISLHDHTEHPKTGAFSNILLGHYGTTNAGEKVEVYETDLPTTIVDLETGIPQPGLETWPVSVDFINEYSPHYNARDKLLFDQKYTSARHHGECTESPSFQWPESLTPPPNFPNPVPISFIVFACPATNLTQYDEITETMMDDPQTRFSKNNAPSYFTKLEDKKIYKRKDYDLAHQGIPLFEFHGGNALYYGQEQPTGQFLSIEALGPWHDSDPYLPLPENEYWAMTEKWVANIQEDEEYEAVELRSQGETSYIRDSRNDPPAPYHGVWWNRFYQGMYEDMERWHAVKRAMGVGKLRVVVRWVEDELTAPTPLDLLNGHGERADVSFGSNYGATERGVGKSKSGPSRSSGGRSRGNEKHNSLRRNWRGNIFTGMEGGQKGGVDELIQKHFEC